MCVNTTNSNINSHQRVGHHLLRTGPAKILQCESCGGFDLLNVTLGPLGVQTVWGSMD